MKRLDTRLAALERTRMPERWRLVIVRPDQSEEEARQVAFRDDPLMSTDKVITVTFVKPGDIKNAA